MGSRGKRGHLCTLSLGFKSQSDIVFLAVSLKISGFEFSFVCLRCVGLVARSKGFLVLKQFFF